MAGSGLTAEQQRVLNAILRIGRRRRESPKEIKAAVETGLVESGLRNLRRGDADSLGWRQERASLYRNPLNLGASINRFYDETSRVQNQYGTAGALAAAVQRPAAQYRGRYQQVSGRAQQLLRDGGGAGAGGGTSLLPGFQSVQLGHKTAFDQAGFEKAQRAALVGGLIARTRGTNSILFRSGLLSTQRPDPADFTSSSLTSRLVTAARPATVSKSEKGIHVKGPLLELFWQGAKGIDVKNGQIVPQGFVEGHTDHVHVAAHPREVVRLGKIAQQMGLHVGENPHFGGVAPVHAKNSYHYRKEAIDVSGPANLMALFAHRVARIYGAK